MTSLAPALQAFFTERLISQRAASPNTIAGYKPDVPRCLCRRLPRGRRLGARPGSALSVLAQPRAPGCSAPQGGDRSVASYAPMESAAPSVRTSPRVIMPSSLRR